jgi:hypothetical protein
MALMRERGYPLVQVVERWNPHARCRQDLFGIIDVLAVSDHEVVGIQATSATNVSSRITKIEDSSALPVLRRAGVRLLVHGWRKKRGYWIVREVDIS